MKEATPSLRRGPGLQVAGDVWGGSGRRAAGSVAGTRALPLPNHHASDDSSHTDRTKSLLESRYTSISSVSLSMAWLASFSLESCRGHAMFPQTSILTASGFPTHSVPSSPCHSPHVWYSRHLTHSPLAPTAHQHSLPLDPSSMKRFPLLNVFPE